MSQNVSLGRSWCYAFTELKKVKMRTLQNEKVVCSIKPPANGFNVKIDINKENFLMRASIVTDFIYQVTGLSVNQIEEINNINTANKIIDCINKIHELGSIKYVTPANDIFYENLMLIDSRMDELVAHALIVFYKGKINTLADIVKVLEKTNPMDYSRPEIFYRFKMKKLLCSIALGMVPSKP